MISLKKKIVRSTNLGKIFGASTRPIIEGYDRKKEKLFSDMAQWGPGTEKS